MELCPFCKHETFIDGSHIFCKNMECNFTQYIQVVEEKEEEEEFTRVDLVNHPPHYTSHPSGIECIQIAEHMNFCLGNALKYIWRAGLKGNELEDLEKAIWYLDREIARRKTEPMT